MAVCRGYGSYVSKGASDWERRRARRYDPRRDVVSSLIESLKPALLDGRGMLQRESVRRAAVWKIS